MFALLSKAGMDASDALLGAPNLNLFLSRGISLLLLFFLPVEFIQQVNFYACSHFPERPYMPLLHKASRW